MTQPNANERSTFDSARYFERGSAYVVKIGSALLVDARTGGLRTEWLSSLADDVAALSKEGKQVALVSSGAIALGRGLLGLPHLVLPLEQSQAAAAAGQIALARAYSEAFAPHGMIAAQILLTLDDTKDRRRYLNGRATLSELLRLNAVPIVNENDTVATDEIRYGDNDRLAARVALMMSADRLILLSDVDGIYTANPVLDASAQHVPVISSVTPEIEGMAGGAASTLSKGGMTTKVIAAKTALSGGCAMAITLGSALNPLRRLADGARSSWFVASETPQSARKQWIAGLPREGVLVIDAGAALAIRAGRSLLPAGLLSVSGEFGRGALVELTTVDGANVGVALSGYAHEEAHKIVGRQSAEIEQILGYAGRVALAHRDDMVLWE